MRRTNLTGIDNDTMCQILGVTSGQLKRDIIYKDLEIVNGYRAIDTLDFCLCKIDKKGSYNVNMLDFIDNLILINDYDIDVEEIKDWGEEELILFSNYTHKDFWNYRIKLFREGLIKIKEKSKKETKQFYWGYSDASVNSYLNSVPLIMANSIYEIFQTSDPHEIYSLIYSEKDHHISSILTYTDLIYTPNTLLNKLYNIKEEGVGKGEAVIPFLFPSKIMGTNDNFDVLMSDNFKCEIKSPKRASFRLGTKGSVGNYKFFNNIVEARNVLRMLVKQIGENNFRNLVSPEFFELSSQFLLEGNYGEERALSSAINSAEISSSRMSLISLWFYLAHIETINYDSQFDTIYQNMDKREFFTKSNNLINTLRCLEYVKEPWKFKTDINTEKKKCFNSIDCLIIFNELDKNIVLHYNDNDIIVDAVSQNGLKVKEKTKSYKEDTSLEEAYYEWNINRNSSFYDIYNQLSFDPVLITC